MGISTSPVRRGAGGDDADLTSGRGLRSALVAAGVALVLAMAGCGSATPQAAGESVTVLGSWEGPELDSFQAMVEPFERRTGISVLYTATRDLRGVIERGLTTGSPPDVAGLPGPGFMLDLARSGALKDLATVIDLGAYKRETAPAFVDLGTIDDRLVGVFIKGTVKGLMWYDPAVYRLGTPSTLSELGQLASAASGQAKRTWCVGLQSGGSSGWPGTDWIEDFLLRQSGPEAFDAWVEGRLAWSSPEVRQAFLAYGRIVADGAVYGGKRGALNTYFGDAGNPLFGEAAGCLFLHQASFMTAFLDAAASPPPTYDFFPFPDIDPRYAGSLIVAGDLFGLLNPTPAAKQLMAYLVTAEAQSIWVARGGALSGNFNVHAYPNDIARREAGLLATARVVRFDASDAMPDEMSAAFWQAVLDFTADQSRLESILVQLDGVRAKSYRA
ncbi:MAG: carbohydrate ABC transporter substrate-binding protein [Chloroflexota bacterium]|nr:MAG: carbohydrate ABC transporter substrate-binding protein [Chloroflexota bacterium]